MTSKINSDDYFVSLCGLEIDFVSHFHF